MNQAEKLFPGNLTAKVHMAGDEDLSVIEPLVAALGRFLRPVAFQNAPDALLPPALRDDNPWDIPQRRSPAGLSAGWGTLAGRC